MEKLADLATVCAACGAKFFFDSKFCDKCGMKRPERGASELPVKAAEKSFDQIDTNGDGAVTRAEWQGAVGSGQSAHPSCQGPGAPK